MSTDHVISGIYNLRIEEVILIDDNTTLLDYGHRFMESLHTVDSRSQTPSFRLVVIYIGCWSVVDSL